MITVTMHGPNNTSIVIRANTIDEAVRIIKNPTMIEEGYDDARSILDVAQADAR